jgi:hypothetical protein
MKHSLVLLSFLMALCASATGATTINATNSLAYGANLGWLDWRGDTNNGAVIGEYICSGYLYAANAGWINLGNGNPANGIRYQNNSTTDFGLNLDSQGNLRGYAYGENIGWINFESWGAPKLDLWTGRFSGHAYSANCGWISLSNAVAHVQTDRLAASVDTDGDGIGDDYEREVFGGLGTADATSDYDQDGASDKQEAQAGTNAKDENDYLALTEFGTAPGGTAATFTWTTVPSRGYYLEKTLGLSGAPWLDSGLGFIWPDGTNTTRLIADTNAPMRFYRVRAVKPLSP